jgi:glucose/arabinose dehydrogenase
VTVPNAASRKARIGALACVPALVALAIAVSGCAPTGTGAPATGGKVTETVSAAPAPTSYSGFVHPTNIVAPDDGSGRIFVTQQPGVISVIRDGAVSPTPALDIRSRVGSAGNEQGLLGMAFPPHFAEKQYAYIYFTDPSGTSRFFRIHISAKDPDAFDPAAMQEILTVAQPYANHNGGQLAFGPDGYLYIGLGDGGSGGDPGNRGQSLATLLGKILRIDVESTPDATGYAIPAGNPFAGTPGARPEIWLYGLRNPWRFSFDTGSGDLWIGDVGQDKWEEIDRVSADSTGGLNFGWSQHEGTHLFKAKKILPGFAWPVVEYPHPEGESVTGGFVYRGSAYPDMRGVYVFGDFVKGQVWTLSSDTGTWVRRLALQTTYQISTFGTDGAGELWLADWSGGTIQRVSDLGR